MCIRTTGQIRAAAVFIVFTRRRVDRRVCGYTSLGRTRYDGIDELRFVFIITAVRRVTNENIFLINASFFSYAHTYVCRTRIRGKKDGACIINPCALRDIFLTVRFCVSPIVI